MATLIAHLPDETLPHDVEFEIRNVGGAGGGDLVRDVGILIASVARHVYEANGVKNALTELPEAQA